MPSGRIVRHIPGGWADPEWTPASQLAPPPPPPPPPQPPPPAGVVEALAEQRNELEQQLTEMRAQAELRVRQAWNDGYAKGKNEAQKVEQQLHERMDELAQAVAALAELKPELRRQAEEDLVKLSFAIARRILYREIQLSPDALRGIVSVALERLKAQEIYEVRTHPEHEAALKRLVPELTNGASVQINADPALARGSILFRTACGTLDASVETQIAEVESGLADRLLR